MFRFYPFVQTKKFSIFSYLTTLVTNSKTSSSTIEDLVKYNMKYLDDIEIHIYNPNTVFKGSIMRPTVYTSTLYFRNNDMNFRKTVEANSFDELVSNIKHVLEQEIKL
jgi:hypothetical protein